MMLDIYQVVNQETQPLQLIIQEVYQNCQEFCLEELCLGQSNL